jgi:PPE-repeat protein
MGRATSVGALTVPSAWTGAAPVTAAGTAMHVGDTPAISAAPAGTRSAMPPMMPIANMGGRGGAEAPTRFELRSTVIPLRRPPDSGPQCGHRVAQNRTSTEQQLIADEHCLMRNE